MYSLAFLCGVLTAFQLPNLPSAYPAFAGIFSIFIILLTIYIFNKKNISSASHSHSYAYSILRKSINLTFVFSFAFLSVLFHAYIILSNELDDNLQGKNITVIGIVSSLPESHQKRTRFMFDVEQLGLAGDTLENVSEKGGLRLRLNWFGKYSSKIKAGEKWKLLVRLKKPHGMLNPGGFDYEKWLFERRVQATGYVKKSQNNIRLEEPFIFSIVALRERIKNKIQRLMPDSPYRGIVLALALGDKSEITDEQWKVFTATGTNHLVAISGLHIGLVSGVVFFLAGYLIRRIPLVLLYIPYYKVAALMSISAAFFYAMLAGFAIPTQRALVMICVVMFFMMRNRRLNARSILSYALIVVLLVDPFSALSAGFWLSFIAVAAILYAMQGRTSINTLWWKWGRLQWIVTVALIPVLLFSFQTFSIISPVANIIAVPWVSFFVVPLVLLSVVFSFISQLSALFLTLSHYLLHLLWLIMAFFAELPFAQWQQFSPVGWTLIPSFIGVLLLLAPKGMPAKYLAIIFLLPMFIVKPDLPKEGEYKFTLLDVGQGLASIVQTKNHLLIFDTGPAYMSGFNTGEAVILPFLRAIGIEKVDKLIISHGDNDHIGGMQSIVENIPVSKILTSVPSKVESKTANLASENVLPITYCLAGDQWIWDGVLFEILNPKTSEQYGQSKKSGNNRSCVLRISAGDSDVKFKDNAILLTGDIEKPAEKNLLKRYDNLKAKVLVAPHHGSNTSSTNGFIDAVDPRYVLYPVGFRNRFGFPKSKVTARYKTRNINEANTSKAGAITFYGRNNQLIGPFYYRNEIRRFWHQSMD